MLTVNATSKNKWSISWRLVNLCQICLYICKIHSAGPTPLQCISSPYCVSSWHRYASLLKMRVPCMGRQVLMLAAQKWSICLCLTPEYAVNGRQYGCLVNNLREGDLDIVLYCRNIYTVRYIAFICYESNWLANFYVTLEEEIYEIIVQRCTPCRGQNSRFFLMEQISGHTNHLFLKGQ